MLQLNNLLFREVLKSCFQYNVIKNDGDEKEIGIKSDNSDFTAHSRNLQLKSRRRPLRSPQLDFSKVFLRNLERVVESAGCFS